MKHLKQSFKLFGFLTVIYGLSACTAKIDGTDSKPQPKVDRFAGKARVDGPVVEGDWTSGCVYYSTTSSRILSFSFKGSAVTRTSEMFSEAYCQKSSKKDVQIGEFIFSKAYADKTYEISYGFDAGDGWVLYTQENVLLEGLNLYVSDYRVGEYAKVNRDLRMNQIHSHKIND